MTNTNKEILSLLIEMQGWPLSKAERERLHDYMETVLDTLRRARSTEKTRANVTRY